MKYLLNTCLFASLLFGACKKELSTDAPSVNVALNNARSNIGDTLVFKLGDTCRFAFDGYADNIVFWAGTNKNKYEFKDRAMELGIPTLSFTSTAQWGSQNNTLQVLATNKLPALDSVTVVNANWTNITSRTPLATSATAVNTGSVNLSDLVSNENDSLFIAFKYTGTTGSTQRTWVISNYTVNNVLPGYSFNLASLASDNVFWTRYGNVWTPTNARWVATTNALTIVGGGVTAPSNTSWIVSKPMYVGRVSPDIPTAIVKNITASATTAYEYKYASVGKYKATFVFYNTTLSENKLEVKEFNIKIVM
ncbi:DUF5017 domain-containing protein [Pedobacter endophyticus]|uniref:DUF5017 domain-containing protein n=1 Tax=Pedobacter endophyticus TaxID=2789740 RepID=A0A7S9KY49_9SPHI|nr:DUF5017 domain-containing protein [Pedobacter endophyticus]QPH38983.1 DUF5017 domain-containing protein [Pedobacter endophyticus]